jgi:hypothetical protein
VLLKKHVQLIYSNDTCHFYEACYVAAKVRQPRVGHVCFLFFLVLKDQRQSFFFFFLTDFLCFFAFYMFDEMF